MLQCSVINARALLLTTDLRNRYVARGCPAARHNVSFIRIHWYTNPVSGLDAYMSFVSNARKVSRALVT
jgi:hypothetical protein